MRWWLLGLLAGVGGCSGEHDDAEISPAEDDPDGDGYGAPYDCEPHDASVNPGADEVWYDGVDQDCDGESDYDQDGDGQGRIAEGADCDDLDPAVFAGADERCDGVDNDCDTRVDEEAVDALPVYADDDGDGFGRGDVMAVACAAEFGESPVSGDCNDADPSVNPGQVETCNGVDDDCDAVADDTPVDGDVFFADADADGFGDLSVATLACEQPEGFVPDHTDCDDTDTLSHPGATEVCDLEDNDCDGTIDEDTPEPRTYYADTDGDGFGTPASTLAACGAPEGYVESSRDCDDTDPTLNPRATETCDDRDNDCDGIIDTDAAEAVVYYPDADGDGYGDPDRGVASCDVVTGYLTDGSDCDDADAGQNPAATEACDGEDDDCDGTTDPSGSEGSIPFYRDADADGYGDAASTVLACTAPYGYTDNPEDCDDLRASSNPGLGESCDGVDNDCDGDLDEDDATDASYWYADGDGDGYGDPGDSVRACDMPAGYIADGTDCDDDAAAISPVAAELDNLADEDCDGLVDEDFVTVGDVVITEIARQPYAGGSGTSTNSRAQWFEVVNTSSRVVDLSMWYVEEMVGDSFYVSPDAGIVLEPGAYAVFCYDEQWFATPSVCAYTWGDSVWESPYYDATYYLDRDEDLVSVHVAGTLMDEVHWTYDPADPCWPRVAHYAMQLDGAEAVDPTTNDECARWCIASESEAYSDEAATGSPDFGTPGEPNGTCDQ